MAENSKIEWTDATWNPIRARRNSHPGGPVAHVGWHCEKVSAGCDNCYAQGINLRLGTKLPFKPGHLAPRGEVEVFLDEKMLLAPLRWKKPRMIFVNSMTDSFGRFVTDEMLDRMFAVMALCPQHTFQVLTKRPDRMREYFEGRRRDFGRASNILADLAHPCDEDEHQDAVDRLDLFDTSEKPLPNVWLGTSVEDQATANARIPELLATPAAIRFISAEPLLGAVDLTTLKHAHHREIDALTGYLGTGMYGDYGPKVGLVIVGGESGPGARPMHPDWARGLRDQCVAAGVPFFFKQWGEWGPGSVLMTTGEPVFRSFPNYQTWVNKAPTWVNGGICMDALGRRCKIGAEFMRAQDEGTFPVTIIHRVGKKHAGRQLDGHTWDQMPGVANG